MVTDLTAVSPKSLFFSSVTACSSKGNSLAWISFLLLMFIHILLPSQLFFIIIWVPNYSLLSRCTYYGLIWSDFSPRSLVLIKPFPVVGVDSSVSQSTLPCVRDHQIASPYRISFNMHFQILYILQIQSKFHFLHKLTEYYFSSYLL